MFSSYKNVAKVITEKTDQLLGAALGFHMRQGFILSLID